MGLMDFYCWVNGGNDKMRAKQALLVGNLGIWHLLAFCSPPLRRTEQNSSRAMKLTKVPTVYTCGQSKLSKASYKE